jgi:glycosyltransferase involved in cell wall biosynthesis
MRVLMVSSLWPPVVLGGAEQYAAALRDRLHRAGHEVGVVTLGVDAPGVVATVPPRPYPMEEFATQPRSARLRFHLTDVVRRDTGEILADACARFRPDVVHSHVVQGMGPAALTEPARLGIPHVHTLHDYWLLCPRNSMVRRDGVACGTRCTSCRVLAGARDVPIARHPPEVVVAVSEAVARPHLAARPWMRDRTRVVYNPVEDPIPRPPRPADAVFTFGFLGRLGRDKGIVTLLDAFGNAGLDARLVVAGRGPEAARVRAAGVDDRGWVDATGKDALLAELDCLVVPSEWSDPAPLVVNEARARGITVIGTTVGGIPELVAPEHSALLVAPGDVAALTDALRRVATAPDRYRAAPAAAPMDWPGHLAAIELAYTDAGA